MTSLSGDSLIVKFIYSNVSGMHGIPQCLGVTFGGAECGIWYLLKLSKSPTAVMNAILQFFEVESTIQWDDILHGT